MGNFAYDIQLGFLAFPLVAIILAMPYALYQYRRFGAISIWKTFVVFTFILYCLCAVSLIVFPLPKDPNHIVEIAQTPQLHPFNVINDIRETTNFDLNDRSTWGPTLKAKATYEAIFNVMLTMPLGAYLCYLFRCRWWMALMIGMATTLLFETSQLTGLFGIYEHPYRLFDVDDLILNTTGCMLGFWLMIPLTWALPSMTEVNERSKEKGASRVTFTRRMIAAFVDLTVLVVLFAIAWMMLSPTDAQIAKALAIDPSRTGAKTLAFRFIGGLVADPMSALLLVFGIGAVLFALVPTATKGRTIGKAIVGIRIVKTGGQDAPVLAYWMRYFATAFFCLIPLAVVMLAPEEIEGVSDDMLFQIVGLIVLVWLLTIVGRVVGSFNGYPYVSLSEIVSGTRLAPSNQAAPNEQPNPTRRTTRSETPANVGTTQAATADDHGKQAALDSLFSVNYDEQHPIAETSNNNALTEQLGHNSQATPTQQLNDVSQSERTQLISNSNLRHKIRRDQRPDAGSTQAFKPKR